MRGNKENLIGKGLDSRTIEEQRKIAVSGGIASGIARKKKKMLKECLEMLLERDAGKDKDGNVITGVEAMAIKAMQAAMAGDWKAWELVRDTAGQKPVEKVVVSEVSPEVVEEVESIINGIE